MVFVSLSTGTRALSCFFEFLIMSFSRLKSFTTILFLSTLDHRRIQISPSSRRTTGHLMAANGRKGVDDALRRDGCSRKCPSEVTPLATWDHHRAVRLLPAREPREESSLTRYGGYKALALVWIDAVKYRRCTCLNYSRPLETYLETSLC